MAIRLPLKRTKTSPLIQFIIAILMELSFSLVPFLRRVKFQLEKESLYRLVYIKLHSLELVSLGKIV
jgi:hypothetical protein